MKSLSGTAPPASVRPESVRNSLVSGTGPQPRATLRAAIVATIVGLIAFLLVQAILTAYNLDVAKEAIDRGMLVPSSWDRLSIGSRLPPALLYGGLSYLMLALVGSAIGSRGHRMLFALPAGAYVLMGILVGTHQPEPIGTQWGLECYSEGLTCATPWFGHPWIGPLVDLALVLVPVWVVVRRVRPRRWPERADAAAIAAILTVLGIVATSGWAMAVIQNGLDERALVAVAAAGIALGTARPWWPWLHVSFAVFAVGSFGVVLSYLLWPDPNYRFMDALPYLLEETWPIVAVALIGSMWQPLAWLIRKLQERPVRLVIAVNLLNIMDAIMTFLAVRSGGAFESNPVVRLVGLPTKAVLVALLTWLLYRRKPTALVWPFVALLCVAGYHVAGIFVNGWR
jgi:hypothetical protein